MESKSRSLEEIKTEILRRAGKINPFERVNREEVEGLVGRLSSLDPDLWGSEWGKLGQKYELLGEEQERQGKREEAGKTYCVNGKEDDQHPVQDIYLLLEHGSPKEVRIFPGAGHMGRVPGKSNHEVLEIVTRWLKQKLS